MKANFLSRKFIFTNKVFDEILRGQDDLTNWAQSQLPSKVHLDCHTDINIMANYGNIMAWGNGHPQYIPIAKQDFSDFNNADPFIVATALEKSAIVVSQEVSAPFSKKNIKLPDVCVQFGVGHTDTFSLLRSLGFTM